MDGGTAGRDRGGGALPGGGEERGRGTWFRQHPRLIDLVVVLAIFAYNLPIQFGSVPEGLWPGTSLALSVALCAPYLWRRRRPLLVYACIQAAALVQIGLGVGLLVADVLLLLAVYNLAVRMRWQVSAAAAAVTVAWLLIAVGPALSLGHLSIGDVGVLVAVIAWAWTWGRLVQTRRRYIGSLHERAEQLEREKAAEATMAATAERTRIAREIHDVVSHSLSVMVVMSDGAATTIDAEPAGSKTAMLAVRDTGRTALADMRRMLGVLRDGEPGSRAPQPGIAQLDRLIEDSAAAGLPVTFSVEGQPGPVTASVDLTVYRVVQEALTNVRRHAGPSVTEVRVIVRHEKDMIRVSVSDDGAGPAENAAAQGGHGLIGMRERVAAHQGVLRTGARPDGGFEVNATVPKESAGV